MTWLRRLSWSSFGLLAVGCSSGFLGGSGSASTNHAPAENTAPPVDALADPAHPGLEACASSVSSSDLADALEIASDFELSCHELVVCGGLITSLGSAVVNILLNAALGGGGATLTYMGNGVYQSGNTGGMGTTMDITTMLGADTSFGKAGDIINFNLLDIATYFTGVKVTANASINTSGVSTYNLGVTFTGLGPGVELLGLGKTPSNPLTVSSDKIVAALGQIQVKSHVHQADTQGHSLFNYDIDGPTQSLASALSGDPVPFNLAGVMGGRADLMQTIAIKKWQINYLDTGHSGFMNGTISFAVSGGKLPYVVTFKYPNRKTPDVTLACGN
ncbi:MAG: hypothetical protein ACHREM_30820 [Polyangiales bacterium]